MFKKKFSFVFLIVIALLSIIIFPQRVDAATNDNRVLLVYDSQNDVKNDKVNISALQRSLTSMNLRVKTLQQQKYQKGTLNDKKYMGVITMINWRQVGLINQDYLKDRDEFSGIKLHIGENLTQTEINQLGVQVQKIYQQQLILSDKKDRETLPFKESITVITKTGDSSQQIGVLSSQQQNQKNIPLAISTENRDICHFSLIKV